MEPRLVTVNDLYAFDPNAKVSIEPFKDIIGRHFKQPKEGLGYDNSPSAHMWRTLAVLAAIAVSTAIAVAQNGKAQTVNGLQVAVTGIERAEKAGLKDCPPGTN